MSKVYLSVYSNQLVLKCTEINGRGGGGGVML